MCILSDTDCTDPAGSVKPQVRVTLDGFLFVLRGECRLRVFDAHAMTLERQFEGAHAIEAFAGAAANAIEERAPLPTIINTQAVYFNGPDSSDECHSCSRETVINSFLDFHSKV